MIGFLILLVIGAIFVICLLSPKKSETFKQTPVKKQQIINMFDMSNIHDLKKGK